MAKRKATSTTYHTKNGRLMKGWLLKTSNPRKKVSWKPYRGKSDLHRGITPAQAYWWLFSTKAQALKVKKQLLEDPNNKTMKLNLQYKKRLGKHTYWD